MKTVKDYKDWIDTYENPTESEKELIDSFKDILDEIFQKHEKEIAEKDKELKFRINVADEIAKQRKLDWSKVKKLEKELAERNEVIQNMKI